MIAIQIGDEYLDLPPNQRINVQLNNPLFNEDNLSPGSFSYTFDVPVGDASPKNERLLQNPSKAEAVGKKKKFDAKLLFDDVVIQTGKLVRRGGKNNRATCNFTFGAITKLTEEFRNKKLREVMDETITIDSSSIPKKIYIKPGTAGASPYSILVNDRRYENATLAGLATDITNDTSEPRATATLITVGATPLGMVQPFIEITPTTNPNDPLSPLSVKPTEPNGNGTFGYIWYVEAFDFSTYNTAFTDFLSDYWTATPANDKVRFPFFFNDNLHGEVFSPIYAAAGIGMKLTNFINAHNGAGLVLNNAHTGTPFRVENKNSLQPFVLLEYVLDQIASHFGFTWGGNWKSTMTQALIDNSTPLDVPMDFIGDRKFIFWRRSFNINELVPDWTVLDFMKALQSRYNLSVVLNERTQVIEVNKREPVARSYAYKDISAQAGIVTADEDLSVDGMTYNTDIDKTDGYALPDDYVFGNGEGKMKVMCSGLPGDSSVGTVDFEVGTINGPLISRKANEKFGLRLFYYNGWVSNGTFSYARASTNTTWNETLAGVNGIVANFFEYWMRQACTRQSYDLEVFVTLQDLRGLDWQQKLRYDRSLYLYKSINIELGPGKNMKAEATLYST